MKFTRTALATLLLAPLAAPALAEVTFTPMAAYQWFDSQEIDNVAGAPDVKSELGYALALGYRFTPALGLEANYGRTESELIHDPNLNGSDVRNSRLTLDGYYAFNADGMFSPYVLVGGGQGDFRASGLVGDTIKDTIANAGVGAFVRFNDYIALRMEGREVYGFNDENHNTLALLGLEFSPGSGKAAEEEAAPEPMAEEQAPVEALAAAPVAAAVVDSDGDSVADDADKCAETPAGVQVDAMGCPLDGDADGVADYLDKCPATAEGVVVDDTGCDKVLTEAVSKQLDINFDSGKAVVKDEYKAQIAEVATLLKQYPATKAEIQGHTDASGKKASNDKLSQARADAVKDVLVKEMGVDASRVSAKGYGSSKPVADNKTAEGRAKNRRVIAVISGEAKKVQKKKK